MADLNSEKIGNGYAKQARLVQRRRNCALFGGTVYLRFRIVHEVCHEPTG